MLVLVLKEGEMDRKEDQRKAFLDAIRENPSDAATRYAYADWLDENDEPEEADFARRWTKKGYDFAVAWFKEILPQCGYNVINYGKSYDILKKMMEKEGLDWGNPDQRNRVNELRLQAEVITGEREESLTYETLIEAGYHVLEEGYGWTQFGDESARNFFGEENNRSRFWECWQLITGVRVLSPEALETSPFNCSC